VEFGDRLQLRDPEFGVTLSKLEKIGSHGSKKAGGREREKLSRDGMSARRALTLKESRDWASACFATTICMRVHVRRHAAPRDGENR
jgi:hypothetical protein